MTEPSSPVARLFESLAADYDRSGVAFFEPIAAHLVDLLRPAPGERWLDVGCGPGAVLLPAAAAVQPGGSAVGIDVAPAMVERARAAASEQGLVVDVRVDDAMAPQVDGPFDAITSSLVLFFLPDPLAALRAWRPLLRPGGRLGVVTFGPFDERLEHVEQVLEPWTPPALRDPRTTDAEGPFESDAGMERLVADAGFVGASTDVLDLPVRFADAAQWVAFSWSVGQRAMWLAVPEDERPAVQEEAVRRFTSYADSDGSATFTVGIRTTVATAP